MKRGNLYLEQHQIGIWAARPMYAGRWLELYSNIKSRGMIADLLGLHNPAYRLALSYFNIPTVLMVWWGFFMEIK